jgi:hypothetical protein
MQAAHGRAVLLIFEFVKKAQSTNPLMGNESVKQGARAFQPP